MLKTNVRESRTGEALPQPSKYYRSDRPDYTARQTLETIFRHEREGLIRFLRSRVGSELASDIAQEVFLRAATSPQLSSLVNPRGFLLCIARNLLIDTARRKQCRVVTLPMDEARDTHCDAQQEHELEAGDLILCLERALTQLPERTRTIFIMNRFDDMAYRDIRNALDISMGAVEYHMMKALSHLRSSLCETV
ncbi:sigma-70 family RNA polymerase sigma factor [Parasphingorhabdus sp. JC815]|uniref:RNA polymerase sigma factor n=1 Tax=Parasphingorhabdus sp. JC815 TaxID=3232140 RepID=UPI00345A8F46